jgi:hypothetical protein
VFQLKAFALQMLHNNVDISASGLFIVDKALLFSVNYQKFLVLSDE